MNKYIDMYIALAPKGDDVDAFKENLVQNISEVLGVKIKDSE